ncbi:hypothetical protein BGZ97_007208 [Linnemannia gamsii]|uniref:Uncharacterized protein n=1 Tax=Linnemannia gamsii TaxID=64522 RepID=A0A9P6UV81_9FUNG|nr:hypothetical protein BGZ97_007208 [Linnemannia gamsii]
MNPERKGPDFIINVHSALSKQLRCAYFVVEEPGTDHVTTWDIEKGVCVSSFAGLSSPEQKYNISNISTMSADGQMIALPGRRHVDLFWTATWTLLGTCVFYDMELMERIGYVQFSRFDTQLVVGIGFGSDSRENFTFYRKNRGYILNTATMMVVERFVSPGSHAFLFGSESLTKSPQVYCIGGSQVSLFSLEDRIIQSPSKLRGQCAESCLSISSFKRVGRNEMVSLLSGLRFKVEKLAKPVVFNGRLREKLSFVAVTAWDNSRECHPVRKMSVPLPRVSTFRSARFVGGKDGCSYLLVVLNKLIMVWSTPTSSRGQFVLRLVQGIESDTKWRICPHNQLYGRKASHNNSNSNDGVEDIDEGLIDNRSLHNPIEGSDFSVFMNGISNLVEIFDLAVTVSSSATAAPAHSNNGDDDDTAFLRHDILRYVSTYINCHPSDHHPDNSIVLHICESWTPIKHSATLLFLRSLLLENSDAPSAWRVPRPLTTHGRREGQGEGEGGNPIMCMINKARTDPQAMEVAKVLGEYLLRRARIEKDPYFLVLILQTLQELMVINSGNENLPPLGADEFVAQLYRGFAYIPARRANLPLGTMGREQKLPLVGARVGLSPRKDMVAKEIYYASFDMLWFRTDSGSAATGGGGSTNGGGGIRWVSGIGETNSSPDAATTYWF